MEMATRVTTPNAVVAVDSPNGITTSPTQPAFLSEVALLQYSGFLYHFTQTNEGSLYSSRHTKNQCIGRPNCRDTFADPYFN